MQTKLRQAVTVVMGLCVVWELRVLQTTIWTTLR